MTKEEFRKQYDEIITRAMDLAEKVCRAEEKDLMVLLEDFDREKVKEREVFDYGLRLIIDGTDAQIVDEILSNIANQETDKDLLLLKTLQKRAVLLIQSGANPLVINLVLNSYTEIKIKDEKYLDEY